MQSKAGYCVQSQLTNLSCIKKPRTNSSWKHQILKARPVSYLFPSSWILRCVFCEKFFWKFSVLGNLTCAHEARWLRVTWWTRKFFIRSSNQIIPNTLLSVERSMFVMQYWLPGSRESMFGFTTRPISHERTSDCPEPTLDPSACASDSAHKLWKFLGRRNQNLQSSSKVLGRLPFLPLLFLPPAAPGPMLIKTLMFVRVIVLLYPNIE